MASNLFTPTASYALPLSLGQDLVVDFQSVDTNQNAVDYPGGATVTLIIEGTPAVSVDATVSGNHAVCYVPSSTTDDVLARARWRCVANLPGGLGTPPTINMTLANGTVARFDGN